MLHSRHIVVADFPDDTTETLYNGADFTAAMAARDKAVEEGKADAVIVFSHPMASTIRYPLQEQLDIKRRAEEAEFTKGSRARAAKAAADQKLYEAKKLQADAKKLLAELEA